MSRKCMTGLWSRQQLPIRRKPGLGSADRKQNRSTLQAFPIDSLSPHTAFEYPSAMMFGVFDHVDGSCLPLAEHYAALLRIVEALDTLRFETYHIAEHHGTP